MVAIGSSGSGCSREVRTALLMDEAYIGFGLFGRSKIDVAQQPVDIEWPHSNEVSRVFYRL